MSTEKADSYRASWHFAKPGPVQRQRNSKLDEHFSGSGSDRTGDLVREGSQNAGDAALIDPVRVRISFGELEAGKAAAYAVGLVTHVPEIAKHRGLSAVQTVLTDKPCQYMAFEDFNTTGLTGDPHVTRRYQGDPANAFHTFFRAEGQTDKTDDRKQGSKGVGKVTFLAASDARCLLGLTCRHDDARTLMFGTAVLHTHRLNGVDYDGDAWFGRIVNGQVDPIEDTAELDAFREDFQLTREYGEPGLSVVVPWLDTIGDDSITPDRVIDAVLRDHAWPILQGKLVVEIVALDGTLTTLDAAHFLAVLEARSDEKLKAQVRPLAELAAWAVSHTPVAADLIGMHKDGSPNWADPDLLTAEHRDRLQGALDAGEYVAVRVPVRVRPKSAGKLPVDSHFDVFLQRDPDASAVAGPTVQFIRGGLQISGMGRRLPGTRGLVVTNDPGLAGFLRAAENPSHTKWNAKPVKDLYVYAPSLLNYVVEATKRITALLAGDPAKKDATIWAKELSIANRSSATVGGAGAGKGKAKIKRKPVVTLVDPPPPKKRPYEIVTIAGGFAVRPSGRPFIDPLPAQLELRMAYHVRGKDPLARWRVADFNLKHETEFPSEMSGCEIATREPNRLVLRIDSPEFEFKATGFDTRRELFCKPKLLKVAGAANVGESVDQDDDVAIEKEGEL